MRHNYYQTVKVSVRVTVEILHLWPKVVVEVCEKDSVPSPDSHRFFFLFKKNILCVCARVSSVPVSMKHHYSICVVILCCIDFSPPLRQVKESILTLISLVCMHLHFNHYAGQSWSAVLAARFLCLCFVLNWAQLKLVHMSVLPLSLSAGDVMMVLIYISSCIHDGGWGLSGWSGLFGCWRVSLV